MSELADQTLGGYPPSQREKCPSLPPHPCALLVIFSSGSYSSRYPFSFVVAIRLCSLMFYSLWHWAIPDNNEFHDSLYGKCMEFQIQLKKKVWNSRNKIKKMSGIPISSIPSWVSQCKKVWNSRNSGIKLRKCLEFQEHLPNWNSIETFDEKSMEFRCPL